MSTFERRTRASGRRPQAPRERILIVTEDAESSRRYFHSIRADHRLSDENVVVKAGRGSDPMSVVATAKSLVEEARRDGAPFERVFIVVDEDSHSNLSNAIQQVNDLNRAFREAKAGAHTDHDEAGGEKMSSEKDDDTLAKATHLYELILSAPCFEYWLLLHYRDQNAEYVARGGQSPGDLVRADLKKEKEMRRYEKGGEFASGLWRLTQARYGQAKERAIASTKRAERDERINPSTRIDVVVDAIFLMRDGKSVVQHDNNKRRGLT